jgi:hypothetical protein
MLYREARDKVRQIGILAELNACSVGKIKEIIGIDNIKERYKELKKKRYKELIKEECFMTRAQERAKFWDEVLEAIDGGMTIEEAAGAFGVSARRVNQTRAARRNAANRAAAKGAAAADVKADAAIKASQGTNGGDEGDGAIKASQGTNGGDEGDDAIKASQGTNGGDEGDAAGAALLELKKKMEDLNEYVRINKALKETQLQGTRDSGEFERILAVMEIYRYDDGAGVRLKVEELVFALAWQAYCKRGV